MSVDGAYEGKIVKVIVPVNTNQEHTRLQLSLMRTHIDTAQSILDSYDMEISEAELDNLESDIRKTRDNIDTLLAYVEDTIEVDYLEGLYEAE